MKKPETLIPVNADSIKRLIKTTGASIAETSRLLGLNENYLSATLATERLPESVVERLAIFLRVPPDTLFIPKADKPATEVKLPDDVAKDSTIQALLLCVQQLAKEVTEMSDEMTAIRTQEKNFYVATSKLLEKLFNQMRYDPTKVK